MNRIASIDVGTNCALLLIADISPSEEITSVYDFEKIIRLGDGVDRTGLINDAAIKRAIKTLQDYIQIANEYQCEKVLLSGTSAVRDAQNRVSVIQKIKSGSGLEMRVLSGQEEARLTYLGALSNKRHLSGTTFMLDIGGGSSEFILGDGKQIKQSISLNIGSVRFKERFITTDPISDTEFENLVVQINQVITENFSDWRDCSISNFIAIAGTATTLVAMHKKMQTYNPEKVDGAILTVRELDALIKSFRKHKIKEIAEMPGINPLRAGVILSGAVILRQAMKFFQRDKVMVSDKGLRHGLLVDSAGN